LIVLDDFALTPLADANRCGLLEILDDRYDKKSTLIASQLPVEQWHIYLAIRPSPTPSLAASSTTATASRSAATPCINGLTRL